MNSVQKFLLAAGLGTIPIAFSYGFVPQMSLSPLYDIPASTTSELQVFRAIMGLYLGFCGLWIVAAFNNNLARPALYSLIIFMCGLASGRLISLIVDGTPSLILCVYMLGEGVLALVAIILLKNSSHKGFNDERAKG